MNPAQRLYALCAAFAAALMFAFPPFLVYGDKEGSRWITFAPIWDQPYPTAHNVVMHWPYCPEGHPFYVLLLVQLVALVIASSYVNQRLSRIITTYPEYYRP